MGGGGSGPRGVRDVIGGGSVGGSARSGGITGSETGGCGRAAGVVAAMAWPVIASQKQVRDGESWRCPLPAAW